MRATRTLIWLMLKEEFRTHTTYSGRGRFFSFPIMILVASFIFAMFLDRLLEEASLEELVILAHASAFLYGIGVGSFGFMGKQYTERRYGSRNYLVNMPALHPITYRQTFLGLYLRDTIFYVTLVLLPATGGLLLASTETGFQLTSILLFLSAAVLSFQIGTSLSFLGSVLYGRKLSAFVSFTAAIVALVVLGGTISAIDIMWVVPSILFQLSVQPFGHDFGHALLFASLSLIMIILLTASSLLLVKVDYSASSMRVRSLLPKYIGMFRISGSYREIVGKEFVDLKRSGTVGKMFFSFVLPLMFLSFTSWFINAGLGIEVGFNTVFYGAMVGFLGVLLYSWLNNIDLSEYYSLLPVTVSEVIRARLLVFLFLTIGISTAFVILISVLNGEVDILWLALTVMFVMSVYMVVMTAYLTGIRTNTFLFDMDVLWKFVSMAFLPHLCLTILSFSIRSSWVFALMAILMVLALLLGATMILYRGIEDRWGRASFDA